MQSCIPSLHALHEKMTGNQDSWAQNVHQHEAQQNHAWICKLNAETAIAVSRQTQREKVVPKHCVEDVGTVHGVIYSGDRRAHHFQ